MFTTIVRSLLCVFLLVSSVWADSNSPTISNAEYKQYIEASNEFKTAEKDINGIYNELMSVLTNVSEKNALRDEQREWIKMRNAKAFSEGQKGSQVYIDSLIKLTTQRSSELKTKLLNLTQKPTPPDVSSAPQVSPAPGVAPTPVVSQAPPQPAEKKNIQQQSESQTQPSQQSSSESKNQAVKYIIIILLLISVVSVILHFNGKLVLYKDYTDAAITIGGALGSLVILFVCKNILGLSETVAYVISLLVFFGIFIFVFRMSYITNKNIFFTMLSLLTKYTITFIYAFLMCMLMFSGSSKKKGEKQITFERRQKREAAESRALMAAITVVFGWITHIITKSKKWSPVGDYFSLSFKKINLDEVFSADGNINNTTKEVS